MYIGTLLKSWDNGYFTYSVSCLQGWPGGLRLGEVDLEIKVPLSCTANSSAIPSAQADQGREWNGEIYFNPT